MARLTTAALRLLEYLSKARRAEIGLNHLPIICGPRTVKELEGRGFIKVSIELTDRGRRELKERAAREARGRASVRPISGAGQMGEAAGGYSAPGG